MKFLPFIGLMIASAFDSFPLPDPDAALTSVTASEAIRMMLVVGAFLLMFAPEKN